MLRLAFSALAVLAGYRILQENGFVASSRRGRPASRLAETGKDLEGQLDKGLEDSFPASDPPAVTSPTVAGASNIIGTDEVLARKRRSGKIGQD